MKRTIVPPSFTTLGESCKIPSFRNDDFTTFSTWLSFVKVLFYPLLKQWISEWPVALAWPRTALEMKSPWSHPLLLDGDIVWSLYIVHWIVGLGASDAHFNLRASVPKRCWIPLRTCFGKNCTKEMQLIFQNWLLFYSNLILQFYPEVFNSPLNSSKF